MLLRRAITNTSRCWYSSVSSLKPSKQFRDSLSDVEKRELDRTLKQFEIFQYMGRIVPKFMTDEHWRRTIDESSLDTRVEFWEFLGLTQKREERKKTKNQEEADAYKRHLQEQEAIYEAGGMGYGPGMYQLVHSPLRNRKKINNVQGYKVYAAMMTNAPRIAFDVQYVAEMPHRQRSELGTQLQYAISENFAARTTFAMNFVNSPKAEFMQKWFEKFVGFYRGDYQYQTLLPDFSQKGIKEIFNPKDHQIVYISRYARDVIDGPLTADVVSLCVSMDHKRESLGAARRAGIRAVRLPIHRYVKWKSGAQFLPIPNVVNVIRDVYENGGDWNTALHRNISKRHLIDHSEDERAQMRAAKRKAMIEERRELLEAIRAATENS
ncbi:unnamed protein product [Caenorhabditis bovis]|uniref:SAM-dependent MTase TRM10-type domain-containing protein n=1 Tax=Caenorhabditis bovis TaxID=2654633 RepID=A0A8S1EHA5_9PELO|nr:unnamed protein product [Caenorhabditis bovis]